MSWNSVIGGENAAKMGHDAIMTPMDDLYFDYKQAPEGEPPSFSGHPVPLCKVYAFEPVQGGLTPAQAKHILGAQGSVWGEYISNGNHAEYMTYPRSAALAEMTWSPKESRDFTDFMRRLPALDARMDLMGVNYRKPKSDEAALCN
jgi:hexosaminidase